MRRDDQEGYSSCLADWRRRRPACAAYAAVLPAVPGAGCQVGLLGRSEPRTTCLERATSLDKAYTPASRRRRLGRRCLETRCLGCDGHPASAAWAACPLNPAPRPQTAHSTALSCLHSHQQPWSPAAPLLLCSSLPCCWRPARRCPPPRHAPSPRRPCSRWVGGCSGAGGIRRTVPRTPAAAAVPPAPCRPAPAARAHRSSPALPGPLCSAGSRGGAWPRSRSHRRPGQRAGGGDDGGGAARRALRERGPRPGGGSPAPHPTCLDSCAPAPPAASIRAPAALTSYLPATNARLPCALPQPLPWIPMRRSASDCDRALQASKQASKQDFR